MAQDWRIHAVVYFYSAGSYLLWAVLYWRLDLELVDMRTIIEMAFEAGLVTNYGGRETASDKLLERFAALVAAAEREACAKVCEKVAVDYYTRIGREHEPYMRATAEDCARHIRARGQTEERNFCSRCGKRWRVAAGWLPAVRECDACRSRSLLPEQPRSQRSWNA
jgi:hypothetical protein